jgi:hypothetical protein
MFRKRLPHVPPLLTFLVLFHLSYTHFTYDGGFAFLGAIPFYLLIGSVIAAMFFTNASSSLVRIASITACAFFSVLLLFFITVYLL